MRHAHTLDVGLDGHQDSSAVADVAKAHDAEVIDLGTIGTRQAEIEPRSRKRPSKANPLVVVEEARPCGSWRACDLTPKGPGCWVVAPSLMPKKAGDRVTTARRDARPLARLMRSGDLSPGSVPQVEEAASRDLTRAREEASSDRKTAKCRLHAFLLRHASRSTGRAA